VAFEEGREEGFTRQEVQPLTPVAAAPEPEAEPEPELEEEGN
jgi:hypothetical protein